MVIMGTEDEARALQSGSRPLEKMVFGLVGKLSQDIAGRLNGVHSAH